MGHGNYIYDSDDEMTVKPFCRIVTLTLPLTAYNPVDIELFDSSGARLKCNWIELIPLSNENTVYYTVRPFDGGVLSLEATTTAKNALSTNADHRGKMCGLSFELSDSQATDIIQIGSSVTNVARTFLINYGYKKFTKNVFRGGRLAERSDGA